MGSMFIHILFIHRYRYIPNVSIGKFLIFTQTYKGKKYNEHRPNNFYTFIVMPTFGCL